MTGDILQRLRQVDWSNKPESTISSQLIMPMLMLLGYGEHTLHKVREQQTYSLNDPTMSKGSRRIRLDYQPRVYEEGLWVMEAKGSDEKVDPATLGQVRDYAIHPEVRAPLMVTVDAAGVRVFDPWAEHWDEPLVAVSLTEVADRIEELRSVLGADRVADVVRRRHLDHVRRALSASLEFDALAETQQHVAQILEEARSTISDKRRAIYREAFAESQERHIRVLHQSGAWGVAQEQNNVWVGSYQSTRDLTEAILAQPVAQRPTQFTQYWRAIEAVYRAKGVQDEPRRPLWWAHVALLGGCLGLRGEANCEPYATDMARQAARDCLLGFPDDPVAAASWRLQRTAIPVICRVGGFSPLDQLSVEARKGLSPESRVRYPQFMAPEWFFSHTVRRVAIDMLAAVDPWTADELARLTAEQEDALERIPIPRGDWHGPADDPWLQLWQRVDPLLESSLAVMSQDDRGDDLIMENSDLQDVVTSAAKSEDELLRRAAGPLASRLGLSK